MQWEPGQERRRGTRHRMCLVVYLKTADGDTRAAVVRDASEGGAFLLTRGAAVNPGDTVELEVVPVEDGEPDGTSVPATVVRGRVVRTRLWDTGDLWRLALAVRFDATLPASVGLADIAARQSWAG